MIVTSTIEELRLHLQRMQGSVGFVPTMGYLHGGHRSLLRRARQENEVVVLSIFVNPTQFGPNEDLERYPRNLEGDVSMARAEGVDLVFTPTAQEMYPRGTKTTVSVRGVTDRLCGASRPGHFDGVATVVSKLFHIVEPDRAYFGMKDAQQVAVIEQMIEDLNIPLQLVRCPTLREEDGLAMSSRNVYLNEEERRQAPVLRQALLHTADRIREGTTEVGELKRQLVSEITSQSLAQIDYAEVVEYPSIEPIVDTKGKRVLIAVAVRFGGTRLIDNVLIGTEGDIDV